ncbi:MAG: hypothetical protein RQ826_07520 [Xanthomonadales bacterium]|nr:hypothetical protein [Xanthomonadales bacterium]
MTKTTPEDTGRRVVVILGTGGSGRKLVEMALPLLGKDIRMEGVFLEEAGLQQAASLPFVKELCRLTFTEREFHSADLERDLARRIRSARRLVEDMAGRAGVGHSFRNVRGPAVRLLRETVFASDITIFEPLRSFVSTLETPRQSPRAPVRLVVAVSEPVSGAAALLAAARLAHGSARRFSVLLTARAARDRERFEELAARVLPEETVYLRVLPGDDVATIISAIRRETPAMLVLGATETLLAGDALRLLREQLRCPICLVRNWREETELSLLPRN